MRIFLFACMALGAAISSMTIPTPAAARDYPFCIKGEGYLSPVGDCRFDTYQQCLASASGRLNFCDANPYYAYPARRSAARSRKQNRPY
jgi:hypothetical protein